jgi:hypothetical protein
VCNTADVGQYVKSGIQIRDGPACAEYPAINLTSETLVSLKKEFSTRNWAKRKFALKERKL